MTRDKLPLECARVAGIGSLSSYSWGGNSFDEFQAAVRAFVSCCYTFMCRRIRSNPMRLRIGKLSMTEYKRHACSKSSSMFFISQLLRSSSGDRSLTLHFSFLPLLSPLTTPLNHPQPQPCVTKTKSSPTSKSPNPS